MDDIWFDIVMISWDDDTWSVQGLCNKIWSEGDNICFQNSEGKVLKYDKQEYKEFKASWG